MFENASIVQLFEVPSNKNNDNMLNLVASLGQANVIFQETPNNISLDNVDENSTVQISETKYKSIFVCTFCQVFSTSNAAIASHIGKLHSSLLKEGTVPDNYVSKLQALKNDSEKVSKKVGRPKKIEKNSSIVKEREDRCNPIISVDGFYCCKKCHRRFKKLRQHSRHVCLEDDNQEESLGENEFESNDADFKTYTYVQSIPWSKLAKRKSNVFENFESNNKTHDEINVCFQDNAAKVLPDWRNDPAYVPLFSSENEKEDFENHLKQIDYSSVDFLFDKIKKKKSKTEFEATCTKYSCVMCKKVFNSLSHIRQHCLIHTDLKPFTCPKCPYQSNVKGSLYTHMRTHTGNKYVCSQCNFQTLKRSHLLDHEQTHSTNRQCCKLCKNSYKTLRSLLFHVKKYHNNANGKKYVKILTSKKVSKMVPESDVSSQKHISCLNSEIFEPTPPAIIPSESVNKEIYLEKETGHSIEVMGTPQFDTTTHNIQRHNIHRLLDCSVRIEHLDDQLINIHNCEIECNICGLKFTCQSLLENHRYLEHSGVVSIESDRQEIQEKMSENAFEDIEFANPELLECSVRIKPLDEELVEMMLNDILQQKSSQSIELFDDVFHNTSSDLLNSNEILNKSLTPDLTSREPLPLNDINEYPTNSSILAECQKNIDMLDECLRHSNISHEVMANTSYQMQESGDKHQQATSFALPDMGLNFLNNELMSEAISEGSNILSKDTLHLGSELAETKPEEIKLFEKCQRAPAYLCCVCSGIFICSSTLKAHLKEHVNKNDYNKFFLEQSVKNIEPPQLSNEKSELEDVCRMLQVTSNSDVDKELEKLYTSSLHNMWYLPEVSVVLENDQTLIDSFLDDISNFPISGDESSNLNLDSEIFS